MGRFLAPKSDFPSPELLGFSIPDLILDAGIAGYGPYTPICCPREPGSDSQTERTSQWKRLMQRTNGNFRPFSGIFRRIFLDLQGAGVWPGAGVASGGRRAFRRAGVHSGGPASEASMPPEGRPFHLQEGRRVPSGGPACSLRAGGPLGAGESLRGPARSEKYREKHRVTRRPEVTRRPS